MDCKIVLPIGCNAKCSFCFSSGNGYTEDFIEEVQKSLYKVDGPVTANITGGEPSIYPKLIPLVQMLKEHPRVNRVILTSNGSNILDVREVADYITHLNISRHFYTEEKNDELFGVHFAIDYETITKYFNRHGVDVRCNCYLSDNFKDIDDLELMVEWAVKRGFNSIKFRNDFSKGMKMNKWEKMFREVYKPSYEDSCPVCRISEYLYRIPVFFGYGVPEPSDYIGNFEYVINRDGQLYHDYAGLRPVTKDEMAYRNPVSRERIHGCGGSEYIRITYADGSESLEDVSGGC